MTIKEPTVKLQISTAAYHEIVDAMAKHGYKVGDVDVTLVKSTKLEQPIDFRMATIRKDCADIAAKAFNPSDMGQAFTNFVEEIYQYVINGKQPITTEWK